MSELKTNQITSQDLSRKLTINPGLVITSNGKTLFEVTDTGNTILNAPLLLGKQEGATHGGSLQMVTSGGTESMSWTTFSYQACANYDSGVPTDTILDYLVMGFYDGCASNTISRPDPPAGYVFCDGDNGTPDLRTTINPNTGLKDFNGNCGGANSFLSGVWTLYYIIRV
jgi:hypothetical protein